MTQIAVAAIERAIALIDLVDRGVPLADGYVADARAELQRGLTELVGNGRPTLTEGGMFLKLEAFVKECGTAKEAAARLGIGTGFLCDIRYSRKRMPDRVVNALGFQRRRVARAYDQRADI